MPNALTRILITASLGLALSGLAFTQEPAAPTTVSLSNTGFNLPANTNWREERIMSAPSLKLSIDLGTEKNVRGTMSMHSRQLLDINVASATDLRLKFVQSNTTSDIDFGNNRNRRTTPQPLDGKTVLAQRTEDGRWVATFDKRRRPTDDEARSLHGLTYLWAEGVYPDRDVTIGENWKVDAKTFKNLFGSDFGRPRGEFQFTLARIVDHQGMSCAKITGKGQVTSQTKSLGTGADGTGDSPLDATMDLNIEIYRSIELGMDIDVKMTGTMELTNKQDKEALTYHAASPVEFTRTFRMRKSAPDLQ